MKQRHETSTVVVPGRGIYAPAPVRISRTVLIVLGLVALAFYLSIGSPQREEEPG